MSEQLCLQWNDFQDNVKTAFSNFRKCTDFNDVTLACEDGQQTEAHKVILAASSPFFQDILRKNKHSHPLIYMRGVRFVDLVAMIDFLYFGEANVFQTDLDTSFALAQDLLKGLKKTSKGRTGRGDYVTTRGNKARSEISNDTKCRYLANFAEGELKIGKCQRTPSNHNPIQRGNFVNWMKW